MRVYELIFILKPDLPEEEINAVVEQIQGVITNGGGTIDKVDRWGKKRLAYEVKRFTEGYYVLLQYSFGGQGGLAKEIERRLRVTDSVIKFLTVRIDQELKRLEKIKKEREKRAARKPQAASAAPGEPKSRPKAEAAAPGVPGQSEESGN